MSQYDSLGVIICEAIDGALVQEVSEDLGNAAQNPVADLISLPIQNEVWPARPRLASRKALVRTGAVSGYRRVAVIRNRFENN